MHVSPTYEFNDSYLLLRFVVAYPVMLGNREKEEYGTHPIMIKPTMNTPNM